MGVGAQAGTVVVGLSGVRRTRDLALVFLDASVSANTQGELAHLQSRGVRVFRCDDLSELTGSMGRQDASVVGVKVGPLAEGMMKALP